MARVFTVGPNSTYAGILSALSSVSALYTNPDTDGQDWVFECEAFTDITSGNAGIAPTTAGTNNYSIIIRPQVGAHHEGVSGGGYTLYSPFNSYVSLYINAPNTVLEGVQFNVGPAKFLRLRGAGCVFKQCIFNGSSANEIFNEAADNISFLNCLFKSSVDDVKSSAVFKNCVFDVGTSYAILPNSSQTPLVQNCVFLGHVTGAVDGSVSAGSSNNCSHDSSIGSAVSSTDGVDFVSPSTGDYTPTATGALFKAGTNPLSPLSNPDDRKDITGKTRAYWDIGAFAAPASLAENTHLATFTTRPTDTGASGGPNVAGTETNYPGYIDLSEAPQALWDAVTSGGGDIRVFENQAGGLVELPAEVVSCDTSAETGELHYLLPSISASTPQEIRLYADGVSSRYDHADPFGRNAVWGDYAFVLHTESDATDSTGNLSVTEEGTPSYTAGKLGGGAALTNAGFNFSNDTSPYSLGSGYWLSWWGDFNNFSPWGNLIRFASTSSGGATGAISLGRAGTTSNLYLQHDTTSVANVFSGGVSNFIASEEHYYGLRWDGSTAGLYRDATENYSRSEAVAPDMSHANFNRMFWETSSTNSDWNYVDEIRIRNGDPGANWITTEYNNQSDPSSFYTATDPNAGGGVSVAVPAASVTITGYAPTVTGAASISVDVPAGEISVTGYAPTVTSTDNIEVAIPADSLTVTGYAPTVTASDSQEVSPGADSIAVTGYAPTIAITDAQAIVIPAGSVTVTGYAPSVETTSNVTVEVDTGSVSITGHAPAVGTSISVSPAVSTLSITGYAPAVVASVKTVTCTLVDVNGRALPNLSDLSYAWFDEPDPANLSTPVVKGVTESTDGSGVIEVPISGSSLTSGQTGLLVLRSSDGESLGAYNLPVA
jgi:hypothetical protein